MDIDKPLDEIIAAKPKARRGGRPGPRGGSTAVRDRYASNVPKAVAQPAAKSASSDAVKIIISNLPQDVTEAAVRSTVGPVRTVQMNYTSTGKSTGQATVVFKSKGDANKAHAAYHNRMVDNQRPMKVEIALDISTVQSLASRVAPPPVRAQAGKAGAGRGGRGGKTGSKPVRRQKKSAEELDAEMSAYKETA